MHSCTLLKKYRVGIYFNVSFYAKKRRNDEMGLLSSIYSGILLKGGIRDLDGLRRTS